MLRVPPCSSVSVAVSSGNGTFSTLSAYLFGFIFKVCIYVISMPLALPTGDCHLGSIPGFTCANSVPHKHEIFSQHSRGFVYSWSSLSHHSLRTPKSMIQGKLRRSRWQVLSRTYPWWLSCSLGAVGGGQSQPFVCSLFVSVGTSGEPKIAYSSCGCNLPYAYYSLTQPAAATHGFGIFFFFYCFHLLFAEVKHILDTL